MRNDCNTGTANDQTVDALIDAMTRLYEMEADIKILRGMLEAMSINMHREDESGHMI